MTGPVHLHCMDKGQSINVASYCLELLVSAIHDQRPMSGTKNVILHHGIAILNVTKIIKKYAGVGILRHPPYSPDFAPSDFWLFDLVKRKLTDAVDEKDNSNYRGSRKFSKERVPEDI